MVEVVEVVAEETVRRDGPRRRWAGAAAMALAVALIAGGLYGAQAVLNGPDEQAGGAAERAAPDGRDNDGAQGDQEGDGDGGGDGGGGRALPADGTEIVSYSADGRTLTVSFWAGVCGAYAASAAETSARVTVRVDRTDAEEDELCVAMAERRTARVELARPVGGRSVVDERGRAVPVR